MERIGRVQGKVAVVTGAAQGIGAAFAHALAREGAKVVVADILDAAPCVKAIQSAGGAALGIKVDITSNRDLGAMVSEAEAAFGPIQILVNNASLFTKLELKPVLEMSEEEWDRVLTVNARGTFQCCKAVVPSMLKAGGGKIVNIGSGTVYYGPPGMGHYTASKGAVVALTKTLSRELGDKNIQVNAINPGLTESEGMKGNTQFDPARAPQIAARAIKRAMVPEDLVGTLLYLCSSDSDFVTGQGLSVDGGKINA